jgi:hypothetical protein
MMLRSAQSTLQGSDTRPRSRASLRPDVPGIRSARRTSQSGNVTTRLKVSGVCSSLSVFDLGPSHPIRERERQRETECRQPPFLKLGMQPHFRLRRAANHSIAPRNVPRAGARSGHPGVYDKTACSNVDVSVEKSNMPAWRGGLVAVEWIGEPDPKALD